MGWDWDGVDLCIKCIKSSRPSSIVLASSGIKKSDIETVNSVVDDRIELGHCGTLVECGVATIALSTDDRGCR